MSSMKSSESATVTGRGGALLALLAVVAMLVSLASCGVEGDNAAGGSGDDTTTTTEADGGDGDDDDDTTSTTEDDGGDDTTTSTTEDDGDDSGPSTTSGFDGSDEAIRDTLIQAFEGAGMTTEQATCLADGYIDMGITDPDASENLDIMAMMNLFSQCGVSMEDLGGLGAGMGG